MVASTTKIAVLHDIHNRRTVVSQLVAENGEKFEALDFGDALVVVADGGRVLWEQRDDEVL